MATSESDDQRISRLTAFEQPDLQSPRTVELQLNLLDHLARVQTVLCSQGGGALTQIDFWSNPGLVKVVSNKQSVDLDLHSSTSDVEKVCAVFGFHAQMKQLGGVNHPATDDTPEWGWAQVLSDLYVNGGELEAYAPFQIFFIALAFNGTSANIWLASGGEGAGVTRFDVPLPRPLEELQELPSRMVDTLLVNHAPIVPL